MNKSPKHAWYIRYTYSILKNTLGPIARLIFVKEVQGIENIPKTGPAILAFNHQSYFDFLCFVAVCPRQVHFLAAEKFFSHPVWRHFVHFSGQIKVFRSEHDKNILHTTINDHLQNGKVIGIFPEGTRATDPVEMLHAFTGVARYAINGKVPVVPVGIRGAYEVMSKNDKKPNFKKIISFFVGKQILFTGYHDKTLSEKDYRDITDQIMLEISSLSGKKYSYVGKMERDFKPIVPIQQ